ncbi:DNA replication/repair protein RecF [Compostimonas suwonensis]|uniref:DNA replication and repair protein RecF n=1 Tax=Compostimonas suwonensis TaxID=1048394 RepID=A0A2M9C439_9MICO|nr:DNA replication/repair protein RecF [Compostimonas suwonensis]PJJ65293.1 DNA replication and repair protein RecF [Compostimonas suwonensis]
MQVTHLNLVDFRNYRHADVSLSAGPNLVVGRNGQGKTNLVESLGYLSTLGSHRVSTDQALVRQGADAAIVRARVAHGEREFLVEVQINRSGPNKAQVNRGAVRVRDLPRYFSSVLFAPEDLALVRGDPSGRRRYLDQLIVVRSPRIAGVLADYERVLKQRNTLLKSARATGIKGAALSTLDVWDERLIELGSEIIDERARLVAALAQPVRDAYHSVADGDHTPRLIRSLSILGADPDRADDATGSGGDADAAGSTVASSDAQPAERADIRAAFTQALADIRRKELDRGVTLVGPHRDDVVFELNGLPAKGYASHGESWSFALALKLGAAELLRRDSPSGDPVLVLDDVFAELDRGRRARLAEAVAGYQQVIITAAVFDDVPEALRENTIHIRSGEVVEATDVE